MRIEGEQIPEEMLTLYVADVKAPKRINKTKPPVKLNVKIGGDEQLFPLAKWSRGDGKPESPKSDCIYENTFENKFPGDPKMKISLHYVDGELEDVKRSINTYKSALIIK